MKRKEPEQKKRNYEVYRYSWRSHDIDFDWKAWCIEWGKNWCFQMEKGEETERLHYQGIISLKVKRNKSQCLKIMKKLPEYFEPLAAPMTIEEFYVTKPDSRVDGPWSDKDMPKLYVNPDYVVEQYKPWQKKIWDSYDTRDKRSINIIIDETGNAGKTTIGMNIHMYGRGYRFRGVNDADKLIQSVADLLIAREDRDPRLFIFDLTRSANQKKLAGLYDAIEAIKDGHVVEFRYSYKEWMFRIPNIWVFCNTAPNLSYLSKDRWKLWKIQGEDLVEFLMPSGRAGTCAADASLEEQAAQEEE